MQYDTALAHVRDKLTHPQVHRLLHAIKLRHGVLRDQRSALITVGTDVMVEGRITGRPYYTGLTGTVKAIYDDKFADILLDENSTKALTSGSGKIAHPEAVNIDRYLLTEMPLVVCAATGPDESFAELISFVLGQATPQDLDALDKARRRRIDQLAGDLKPGDTVMLANIKTKYLAGLTGTVQAMDAAKKEFSVLLDAASTDRLRYHPRNNKIDIPVTVKQHLLRRIAVGCALITSTS